MTFVESIKTVAFKKYATFEGKASRSELWWFLLFTQLFQLILQYMYAGLSITAPLSLAFIISSLIFFIPTLTVSVRRLHDLDKSGKILIPVIVLELILTLDVYFPGSNSKFILIIDSISWVLTVYFLIIFMFKGSNKKNKYGSPIKL